MFPSRIYSCGDCQVRDTSWFKDPLSGTDCMFDTERFGSTRKQGESCKRATLSVYGTKEQSRKTTCKHWGLFYFIFFSSSQLNLAEREISCAECCAAHCA